MNAYVEVKKKGSQGILHIPMGGRSFVDALRDGVSVEEAADKAEKAASRGQTLLTDAMADIRKEYEKDHESFTARRPRKSTRRRKKNDESALPTATSLVSKLKF